MIGVWTELVAYRTAVAELPLHALLADDPAGALAVVDGGGPGYAADAAGIADAGVVVLADPVPGRASEDWSGRRVIVDRALLRPDVVADAVTTGAGSFSAECSGPRRGLPIVVRDAVGWLRALSGSELVLEAVHASAHGALALLRPSGREGVATLIVTLRADDSAEPRLRALALGPERTEVTVDGRGEASIVRHDESGAHHRPARYESRRRVALRRAIQAVAGREFDDLAELHHDDALAAVIVAAIDHGDSRHR